MNIVREEKYIALLSLCFSPVIKRTFALISSAHKATNQMHYAC